MGTKPYIHQEFPKYMYHAAEPARVVKSQEELEELGDEWHDSPVKATKKPAASAPLAEPPKPETPTAEEDGDTKPDEEKKPKKGK